VKTFSDFGINVKAGSQGNVKTFCLNCSHNRKHKEDKCLSVDMTKETWNCHNCEWRGCLGNGKSKKQIIDTYDYKDESGKILFQSVRFFPKGFSQRQSNGNGGWNWKLDGVRRVPYRLPELIASTGQVFIPGGEKDVETLVKHGLMATTNAAGEGNWRKEFNQFFKGRDVVILEDNDEKGRKHGKVISKHLFNIAKSIKIVRFVELPGGGDVTDYLAINPVGALFKKVEEASLFEGSYEKYFGITGDPSGLNLDFGDDEENLTQSQILVRLVSECELFHSPDGDGFVSVPIEGRVENYRIRSKGFRLWLIEKFYTAKGKPPGSQALSDALGVLEAHAKFKGDEHKVFVRIGQTQGKIYFDLCNNKWEAVEVTAVGWDVVSIPPVKFIRARGMSPAPAPVQGGRVEELRKFLNVRDSEWKLISIAAARLFE